jgi:tetratricopeptide (TPR) repeat protein
MNERALAIFEAAYGADRLEVARTLDNLGKVFAKLGDLPEARCRHERALAIFEAAYEADHPDTAVALSNLGGVLRELGELARAQACEQRARTMRQKFGQN